MTIKEFHEKLKTEVVTDYIVYLKYKYDFETEYTYSNEILVVDSHSDDLYAWLRDWNEGQTDVEVLGYISVWEVDVTKNNQGDLISRSALRKDIERLYSVYKDNKDYFYTDVLDHIDNALTVEVPENTVNCVLTMFGKCSYNETGCSDCEIKDKIRKALDARPKGEWIDEGQYAEGHSEHYYRCSECGGHIIELRVDDFCKHCGADMRVKDELNNELNERPQTIGCFNCKHDYKRMTEGPCKYCNDKFSEWQDESRGGENETN